MKYIILSLVIILASISVEASEDKAPPFSTQELLSAMGGYSFSVRLPETINDKSNISLRLRTVNGLGAYLTGSTNASRFAGKLARVVMIPKEGTSNSYRCSIIIDGSALRGDYKDFTTRSSSSNANKIYSVGDRLIRFGADTLISNTELPQGGDVDVVLSLSKQNP